MSSQISPDCVGLALVDDDAMALAHLESYFSDVEDFTILTATRSPRAVLRFVQSHQVDVLITDVHMEHMDGVEMTREVLRLSPSTRVILLTTVDTDEDLLQGLGAGASGFLLKDVTKHNLIDAVHAIANGDAILTPRITRQVLERGVPHPTSSQRQQEMRKAFDALTPRQREICALISEGLINEEIANQLTVEPASVKRAVTRILATLGLRNRTQIAIGWFKAGM